MRVDDSIDKAQVQVRINTEGYNSVNSSRIIEQPDQSSNNGGGSVRRSLHQINENGGLGTFAPPEGSQTAKKKQSQDAMLVGMLSQS